MTSRQVTQLQAIPMWILLAIQVPAKPKYEGPAKPVPRKKRKANRNRLRRRATHVALPGRR